MISATSPAPAQRRTASQAREGGSPPVILLGGGANALSVARSLGRLGAAVHALNEPDALVRHSRFCRFIDLPVPKAGGEGEAWTDYLLGPGSDPLKGAVLLACSDAGIEVLAGRRDDLAGRFRIDDSEPRAQLRMLDKLDTYREAVAAGVPTPKFWLAGSAVELEATRDELEHAYPVVVKPRLSHVFEGQTGRKLFVARDFDGLASAVAAIAATGTESLIVEMVPGPDDRLCSYYTYLDAESRPLFHFTKRIVRRYPALRGTACYHVTDDVPEAAELGARLFRRAGLRGLANVEFKRDDRDGGLKLIEVNARFTASNCLVSRSGIDLAAFVYARLVGLPAPPTDRFTTGLRLWDPVRDFQSYLELRRDGQLTFPRWLSSVLHRQSFPYFEWSDPLPALVRLTRPLRRRPGPPGP